MTRSSLIVAVSLLALDALPEKAQQVTEPGRSSATWNFDLNDGDWSIPVGFGVGKVFVIENSKP